MKTNRRSLIKSVAATSLVVAGIASPSPSRHRFERKGKSQGFRIKNGRIKQSIMGWTFNPMPTPELAKLCKEIGFAAMEGISRKHYPLVKKLGMDISLVGSHGFKNGPVNPKNHEECIAKLTEAIEFCARGRLQKSDYLHGNERKRHGSGPKAPKKLLGMLEKSPSFGREEKNHSLLGTPQLQR